MFCRYCGSGIAADSMFCQKCGKRLSGSGSPKADAIIARFRLKTPFPYAALLLLCFISWGVWPKPVPLAYTQVRWKIEPDKVLDLPADDSYQQSFSLVLENTGNVPVKEIPIDLVARIEPQKTADVVAGFLGRSLTIMKGGRSMPLTIVLADPIDPGTKRRYMLEGAITAKPSFTVIYEVREEGKPRVLASYKVEK